MTHDLSGLGAWQKLPFFDEDWPRIEADIAATPEPVLPPDALRFAALQAAQPADVRVVILGQDPYPTRGHANGLAFSVSPGTPLPRSLRNIFKELAADLGIPREDGDLSDWAAQGVLLLNSALSVPEGQAGGHAKLGWDRLARQVVAHLSQCPTAFVLWGKHAAAFAPEDGAHLIIRSAHPSPLSARRGFFGSAPFSRVNQWLQQQGESPIRWA